MVESIFITGLGGQGIVTLASLIIDLAAGNGCRASLFTAKGMAQRGGRVTAEIRYTGEADAVFGPRIGAGKADIMVGMELGEAAGSLELLRPEGLLLLADVAVVPAEVRLSKQGYPDLKEVVRLFEAKTRRIVCAPAVERAQNLFMLGLLVRRADRFCAQDAEELIARRLLRRSGREEGIQSFRQGYGHDIS